MSLNNLIDNTYKPWLNVRIRQLCVRGSIFYEPPTRVTGNLIGIANGVTGLVDFIPPPGGSGGSATLSCLVPSITIPALTSNVPNTGYTVTSSPSSDFTVLGPNITINAVGRYMILFRCTLGAFNDQAYMYYTINGTAIKNSFFIITTVAPRNSSTSLQDIQPLNIGDVIQTFIANETPSSVTSVDYGVITIFRISDL